MRSSRCLILLLAVMVGGVSLATTTAFPETFALTQENALTGESAAVLTAVQNYLSLSEAGKLDNISSLTMPMPKGALKKVEDPPEPPKEVPAGTGVITRLGTDKLTLTWIQREFPKSVFENQKRIFILGKIIVEDNFAKVPVNLGNDEKYSLLPWVFQLSKEDGQWKIYDINTPAYAVDYKP
jgi:hypothetical protein